MLRGLAGHYIREGFVSPRICLRRRVEAAYQARRPRDQTALKWHAWCERVRRLTGSDGVLDLTRAGLAVFTEEELAFLREEDRRAEEMEISALVANGRALRGQLERL